MSVRMLSSEEIGVISSFIDFDIVKSLLNQMYDFDEGEEGEHPTAAFWSNRRRLSLWLIRANSIAVHDRYGRWLPMPEELTLFTAFTRKANDEKYRKAISSFIYQLDDVEKDAVVSLIKSALIEQRKRLGINE